MRLTVLVQLGLVIATAIGAPTAVSAAGNSALQLNGSSQYATLGTTSQLRSATFTVELWFKRTGAGAGTSTGSGGVTAIPLITKGRAEGETAAADVNYFFGIDATSGKLVADFEEAQVAQGGTSPGLNHPITGTAVIAADSTWHHAAATYDGATWNLYLDGALDGTLAVNRPANAQNNAFAAVGSALTTSGATPPTAPAGFFAGAVDEVRIWSTARTQAQIQAAKNTAITSGQANLMGVWNLDEGFGTSLADASGNAITGAAVGGPNWVAGFNWTPGNYGLQLNGTTQYTTLGTASQLRSATFTVELWFKRTGAGVGTGTGNLGIASAIPLITKGRAEAETTAADINYFLGIDATSGKLVADFEEAPAGTNADGTNHPVSGTAVINADSTWHHAAATYDGATWNLYLDGALDGTLGVNQPANALTNAQTTVGSALTTGGVAAGFFAGAVDEVRIWSTARTQAQIQAAKNTAITSGQANLMGVWNLDEGFGTSLADASGNAITGAAVAGPNWVAGFVPPPNQAPSAPALGSPSNGSTGAPLTPTLDVVATDPDGGSLSVSFFGRPLASGQFTLIGTQNGVASGTHATMAWPNRGGGQTFEWKATVSDGSLSTTGATWTFHTQAESGTVVIGIGDIASCTSNGDEQTAAVMSGIDGAVITTGDNVYETGLLSEFNNCYEPTWGAFKGVTRPVPGNHDWGNVTGAGANLDGYFAYFGANATDGDGNSYYSYDLDANWHVVNLDSECANVPGGCGSTSPQVAWLRADLAANSGKNVIAVWHKPRFSSGSTNLTAVQPFVDVLYDAGADLILVGHDHIYERFQPLDKTGAFDPVHGIRHMTVGTGGAEHHAAGTPLGTSEAVNDDTYGVTKFVLTPTGYSWQFFPVAGETFTDSGSGSVHAAPVPGSNGLDLGANGASVRLGDPAKLDLGTFTIETWFKRTGNGVSGTTGSLGIPNFIPLVTHGGPQTEGGTVDANWLLGINDATDVIAADFEDNVDGTNHPISGTTEIDMDTWYHAAATYDGTTWRLYLNGQLEASAIVNATPRSDTTQHAGLGVMLETDGTPGNGARFQGVLDEARVWNGARTIAQVRSTINSELTAATGLVARWAFTEGGGSVVADSIAPTANGTIVGTGATRVAGAPFNAPVDTTPPTAPTGLAADPGDGTVALTWGVSPETDVAGYNVYRSTTTPVALTSPLNGGTLVTTTTFTDSTGINGTVYHYAVTAVDESNNESDPSAEVTASPTNPTEQATALDLGTGGAYVTFGNPAKLGLTSFTIETWFKRTGVGVSGTTGTSGIPNFIPLVTHGGPEADGSNVDANWLLGIDDASDVLAADFEDTATGLNHPVRGTTPITTDIWHHAAVTYNGTTWRVYLDGRLEATETENANPRSDTTQHAGLGVMLGSDGQPADSAPAARFQGALDETRVWSGARTTAEIQAGVHAPASNAALVARWAMGEGSGIALDDAVGPDADGDIVGTGSSWVTGASFEVPTVNAGPDQEITLPANALLEGVALDDGQPSELTTTWTQIQGPDSAAIATPSAQTTSVAFAGSGPGDYVFRLTAFDGSNTVFDEVSVTVIDPGPTPNLGLDFDGANDYVTFGDNSTLGLPQFTLETWFRRDGPGVSNQTGSEGVVAIPLVTKGRNEVDDTNVDMNYYLGIDAATGVLVADFEEGATGTDPGLNHPIRGEAEIQPGVWYHAAATYDGSTWRLYLNGVPDGDPLFVGQPVRADSIQDAALATALNSTGVSVGAFDGVLDEVRIWNSARSEAHIQAGMAGPLLSAPGLVARWAMDEGTGGTIASSAGPTVNGTLTNGPQWVDGTPFASTANIAPNAPTDPAPANGASDIGPSPTLSVDVSDPDGGQLTTTFYGRPIGPVAGQDFTIVVIPDTQHYVDDPARTGTFNQQTQWIVDNADDLNVVFVSQLGDVAEHFDAEIEYQRADTAMDILDNAGIPNNLAPGNHDMSSGAATSVLFDQYFPPTRYNLPQNPWYGGWLGEESGQVQRLNKDNYELFSAGGIDFLIIHLEIDMPTYAVQWADEIINRYPDRQVILSTHAFVNTSNVRPTSRVTTRSDGLSAAVVWDQLVSPNCNVFMVVNGHYPGEGRLTSMNSCGQPVHQVLTDYQSRTNGGDGWLRYYTFKPDSNTIEAYTYSSRLGAFETDATSQFTLPYEMSAIAGFQLIDSVETASGETASVPWPGRAPASGYEWYAVTSDGIAERTSETWSFTTAGPTNSPPNVTNPGSQASAEGAVVDLAIQATDPDLDPLTYSATGLPGGLSINASTGHIIGTISFDAAAASPYSVTVSVGDGTNPAVDVNFSWSVSNTNRNPTFDQNLGNRTDAEGAVVSLDAGATDPDGDSLTYAASNLPSGLSIDTTSGLITGTLSSTAAAGSPYAVSVTVRDGATVDATDTFTWTVTDVNREPTFDQDLGDRTDAEGAAITIDAGATDPDNDPLTYAATNLPPGLSINASSGLITGTISAIAATGSPYNVSVTVRDGSSVDATDAFAWTVTDVNHEPTFDQDLGNRTDAEGAAVSLDAGATDPDGDPLTYAATNLPPGLSINTSSGLITGTLASTAAAGSPYAVSVTVRDDTTVDATDTFDWTVTNLNGEPTFDQNLGNRTDAEGAVVSLDAGATDPDGDSLTYAASNLPSGLSIDTTSGLITGTLSSTAAAGSPYAVSVTVRDGATVDATDTFTWTVTDVNREPTFDQDLGDRTDAEGAAITIDAGATDPDNDPLTYAATNLPPGLSINASSGLITGTISAIAATGSPYNVSVTVRDGSSVDATDAFAWTVTDTPSLGSIGLRSSSSGDNLTAKTLVLPKPAGVASGDVLLAAVAQRGKASLTPPSGWTLVRVEASGSVLRQAIYVHVAGPSEPASYTFTFQSPQSAVGGILAYAGVDSLNPIDITGGQANASSTSIAAPSVTTTGGNQMLVTFSAIASLTGLTPPDQMVERYDEAVPATNPNKVTAAASDQPLVSAGATGVRTTTAADPGVSIGQVVALRPAPSGPPQTTVPGAPTNLSATPARPRGVSLTWTAPSSNGGSAITGYQIFRGTSSGTYVLVTTVGNVTKYKDATATSGTLFYYVVTAVNAIGAGPESNEAFATAR